MTGWHIVTCAQKRKKTLHLHSSLNNDMYFIADNDHFIIMTWNSSSFHEQITPVFVGTLNKTVWEWLVYIFHFARYLFCVGLGFPAKPTTLTPTPWKIWPCGVRGQTRITLSTAVIMLWEEHRGGAGRRRAGGGGGASPWVASHLAPGVLHGSTISVSGPGMSDVKL